MHEAHKVGRLRVLGEGAEHDLALLERDAVLGERRDKLVVEVERKVAELLGAREVGGHLQQRLGEERADLAVEPGAHIPQPARQ